MIGTMDKIDFMERYVGLMSDYDVAQELCMTVEEVRVIRSEFKQKCWTCKNACNENNCSWVKTYIYPDYVTIDEDGHIVGCERYESEILD